MAATDACSAPVQEDGTTTTETKTEVEPTNSEIVTEAVTEAVTEDVTSPPEEAHPASETKQSTEQPADGKAKQASENIFSSFLNKSGLGKVMGGKKKKEQSAEAVEANGEGNTEQKKASDQADEPAANGTEAVAEDQAIEKAPENQVKVRSKSLDRLEDPEALNATVDQLEDAPAAEGSEKPATKHIKRWHSFKKLMAQKSHKKSTEESKEAEGSEGASGGTPGDTSTLDSKASESSGQKRWKLKRSWTFQGLKRDPSVVGISKAATGEKAEGEENATENDEAAAPETDEAKAQVDGKTQEKTNTDGEEEKGATAAPHKSMNQHADEIWTSFKKRVIPKSKRSADMVAASGGEEGAAASEPAEQTEEAGKEQAKSAKAKRTHFNRAVSLKNFIMRKGKSTSVDQGDGAPKEGKEVADGEAKDTEDAAAPAGTSDSQQAADGEAKDTEDAAAPAGTSDSQQGEADAAQGESNDKGEAQVANEHTVADGEAKEPATSTPSGPEPEKANSAEPAAPAEPAAEVKTNGENGCSNGTPEEDAIHNHETTLKKDGPTDEAKQENTNSSMDTKILNLGTGNAVAQSGEFAAEIDCGDDLQQNGANMMTEGKLELGTSFELEAGGEGPSQNGGSHSESGETNAEPHDQEEARKRMLYEAAASIIQTVMSAATEQLENEKNFLDNGLTCSHSANNGNYPRFRH